MPKPTLRDGRRAAVVCGEHVDCRWSERGQRALHL